MLLHKEHRGGVAVLLLRTNRLTVEDAADLKSRLAACFAAGHKLQVLDFTAVQFVDSSGLGALISSLKLVSTEGEIAVCSLQGPVRSLFKLTRMDRVFRIFENADDAVAALEGLTGKQEAGSNDAPQD